MSDDHKPLPRIPWEGPDIDQTPIPVPPLVQSPAGLLERVVGWARSIMLVRDMIKSPESSWKEIIWAILRWLTGKRLS